MNIPRTVEIISCSVINAWYQDFIGVQQLLGPSHRYETGKGIISLMYPHAFTLNMYEIYCLEGDLFESIERYHTLKAAEERIMELLT